MRVEEYVKVANRHPVEFNMFKDLIFKKTLKWEGGGKLHKVSGDSGGWTIWGIAYNHNKKLFRNLADFKDTTYDEAAAIAFVKYYMAIRANDIPFEIKQFYFDTAYNMGPKRAIKLLQKCAGVKQDGLFGPMTLRAAQKVTIDCLYNARKGFYHYLVKRNRDLKKFLKGWMNRINDLIR